MREKGKIGTKKVKKGGDGTGFAILILILFFTFFFFLSLYGLI